MRILKRICFYVTVLIPFYGSHETKAQTSISASYPELKLTYLLNPTHALGRLDESEKISSNILYQNYMNLLREIRFTDLSAYYKIGKIHQVGLIANSFHEGDFISKSNASAQYAVRIKVMRQSILSAAVQGGFKSLTIDGSLTGIPRTSSVVPDISLNAVLQNPQYFILVATNQLIGNKVKPGVQVLKLKRFYESRLGLRLNIGRTLKFIPQINALLFEKMKLSLGAIAGIEAYSRIKVAAGSYDLRSLLFQAGFMLPGPKSWETMFLGSYRQLIGVPASLLHNSLEVSVCLSKKIKADVYIPED